MVDLDVEISKCEKKLDLARLNLNKITKIEAQADYEETIPVNVRLANEEKVRNCLLSGLRTSLTYLPSHQRKTYEAEIATLELSKAMFAKLK